MKDGSVIDHIVGQGIYFEKVYNVTKGTYVFELLKPVHKRLVLIIPGERPILPYLSRWERELLAFVTSTLMLGVVYFMGLGVGLFGAGLVFFAAGLLWNTAIPMMFGSLLMAMALFYMFAKQIKSEEE